MGYSVLFYISPLFTFWISTLNVCYRGNDKLSPWEIFGDAPGGFHGSAVMAV